MNDELMLAKQYTRYRVQNPCFVYSGRNSSLQWFPGAPGYSIQRGGGMQ